jgi:hypothetical protein
MRFGVVQIFPMRVRVRFLTGELQVEPSLRAADESEPVIADSEAAIDLSIGDLYSGARGR